MVKETAVVASAVVSAPMSEVWVAVGDTARYPEWVENTLRVIRRDGPAESGSTMEELTRIAGPWKAVTRWRVTEFDPPTHQVHLGDGVAMARNMRLEIDLTPVGDSGTRVSLTVRYTPKFGPMGALINLAIRRSIARSQQRSIDAFASMVGR